MNDLYNKVSFIIGLSLGFLIVSFNFIEKNDTNDGKNPLEILPSRTNCFEDNYKNWFEKQNISRLVKNLDSIRYDDNTKRKYPLESEYLYHKFKVVCLILVHNTKYKKNIKDTWSKSCNEVFFIEVIRNRNKKIPSIKNMQIRNTSWKILCTSLLKLKDVQFNWVLVVKDDTYAIVENLRFMVAGLDYKKKYYLGHAVTFWDANYNSGEAGYALSKGSLNEFWNIHNVTFICNEGKTLTNQEDYYLGKVLSKIDIRPFDTRDCKGFSTFHGFNLQKLFFPGSTKLSNYYKNSLFPTKCCSPYSVTFKSPGSDRLYTYQYLLHELQLFGGGNLGNKPPPTPLPETEVWQSVLRKYNISADGMTANKYYDFWVNLVNETKISPY